MMSKSKRSAFLGNTFAKTLKNLCKGCLTKIFFGLLCQTCFTHSANSRGAVNGVGNKNQAARNEVFARCLFFSLACQASFT